MPGPRGALLPAGYEPLAPLPPAAASVPVWQDRTIASSRLRLLEYSAFMEVQRDPDTVTRGWGLGRGLRDPPTPRWAVLSLQPQMLS